jgi:spermidine synthase
MARRGGCSATSSTVRSATDLERSNINNFPEKASSGDASHRIKIRPLLGLFFLVSGMSSLLYQTAWQRLLGLFYGVGAISSAIVISAFLFGLGLGSLFGGQFSRPGRTRTLVTYIAIELGIGLFGIASIPLIGWLGELTAGADYWLAAVCTFCFLLFPTALMGATLPVAIQVLQGFDRDLLRNVSSYYFMNTIGAAIGCFVAGIFLISLVGLDGTIYVAAFLNLLLAGAILGIVRNDGRLHVSEQPLPAPAEVESMPPHLLYPAVFISGFIAIGYEIIWFRLVAVLLKDSIYTFAIMLSIYLAAIALGSRDVHRIARIIPWKGPRNCYLGLNGIIALSVAGTVCAFYYLQGSVAGLGLDRLREAPILPVPPQQWSFLALGALALNVLACIGVAGFFIALPAYFMGATFPLLASLAPDRARHPARAVSRVYATAVFGNLAGALATGFVVLPVFGTERTILFFVLAGLSFFVFVSTGARGYFGRILYRLVAPAALGLVIFAIFPGPSAVIRSLHVRLTGGNQYFAEGIEGVVLTHVALLLAPAGAMAQSSGGGGGGGSAGGGAGGASAGAGSAVGSPNAGAAGAGTAGVSGVPSGPANVGGLNNSGNDPSGAGNSAKAPTAGTNSLGTANSSGSTGNGGTGSGNSTTTGTAGNRAGGATGGRIDGTVTQGPQMQGDAAIRAEDQVVDKKIKSICKGC